VDSTALSDRESAARLLPKSHRLLLNPKGILPGMGEKLAPPWFGGGSPLHGAPQLPPCGAGAYPSRKEIGMLNHLPSLSGPVEFRTSSRLLLLMVCIFSTVTAQSRSMLNTPRLPQAPPLTSSRDPICQVSTWRALERTRKIRTKCTKCTKCTTLFLE
jgi:hypothetical protein